MTDTPDIAGLCERLRAEVERNTAPFRTSAPEEEAVAWRWRRIRESGKMSAWFVVDYSPDHRKAPVYEVQPLYASPVVPVGSADTLERQAAEIKRMRVALERIADPRNIHFAGDAQVVARAALTGEGT